MLPPDTLVKVWPFDVYVVVLPPTTTPVSTIALGDPVIVVVKVKTVVVELSVVVVIDDATCAGEAAIAPPGRDE